MEKIINQIKFIGGTLSFIIILALLSFLYINQQGKTDSAVINVSGKQRMLTQKISKEVFRLSGTNSYISEDVLKNINEFDRSLKDLINGNRLRGIYVPPTPEIKEQLLRVKSQWLPFKDKVNKFIEYLPKINKIKSYVFGNNIYLLNYSDDIVKMMVKKNINASYIDLAGRQRMLSQRMMFHIFLYLNSGTADSYSDFVQSYFEYEKTINMFVTDPNLTSDTELKKAIEKNLVFWQKYSLEANLLIELQYKVKEITRYVSNVNNLLLDSMDQSVSMYTVYSKNQRSLIENIGYILGTIALLIMIYSFYLTLNIEKLFITFLNRSKDLTKAVNVTQNDLNKIQKCKYDNELTKADTYMQSFVQKIDTMIVEAREAIKESKKIAKELSEVSDIIDTKDIQSDKAAELEKFIDTSEDIAIQSIEDLQNSEKLLEKLHSNLLKLLDQNKF